MAVGLILDPSGSSQITLPLDTIGTPSITAFTAEIWAFVNAGVTYGVFWNFGSDDQYGWFENAAVGIQVGHNFSYISRFPSIGRTVNLIPYNTWFQVVVTIDAVSTIVYINGQPDQINFQGSTYNGYLNDGTDGMAFSAPGGPTGGDLRSLGNDGFNGDSFDGILGESRFYNIALTGAQVLQNYSARASYYGIDYANGTVRNGLSAEYLLRENTGTTVHDTSGNALDGTFVGGQAPTWTSNGLVFTGNHSVQIPDGVLANDDTSVSDFTYEIWIKPTGSAGDVLSLTPDARLYMVSSSLGLNLTGTSAIGNSALVSTVDGLWQNVVVTRAGAVLTVYVNGTMIAPDTITGANATLPLALASSHGSKFLGANSDLSTAAFQGTLGEVRIYNRALLNYEVAQNYALRISEYGNETVRSGLSAEYLLKEGNGAVLDDTSGNQLNGFGGVVGHQIGWYYSNDFRFIPQGLSLGYNFTTRLVNGAAVLPDAVLANDDTSVTDFTIEMWLFSDPSSMDILTDRNNVIDAAVDEQQRYLLSFGDVAIYVNTQQELIASLTTTGGSGAITGRGFFVNYEVFWDPARWLWNQITLVRSGTTLQWYLNGVASGASVSGPSGALFLASSHGTKFIGCDNLTNSTLVSFPGTLGETRLYTAALTPTEITRNFNARSLIYGNQSSVVQTGLIAEYLLKEGTGSTAHDTGVNGFDGIVANTTWDALGLVFNGSNSVLTLPTGSIGNTSTAAFSIEIWAKITSVNSGVLINFGAQDECLKLNTSGDPVDYVMYQLSYSGSLTPGFSQCAQFTVGEWFHLVIAVNFRQFRTDFWWNGTPSFTGGSLPSGTMHPTTTLRTIGNDVSLTNAISGIIGEVRFYNTSLSHADATTNYNARRSVYGAPSIDRQFARKYTEGEYLFREGTGQTFRSSDNNFSRVPLSGFLGLTTSSEASDPTWVSTGLQFGASQVIKIGDPAFNSTIASPHNFSIETWVNVTSWSQAGGIIWTFGTGKSSLTIGTSSSAFHPTVLCNYSGGDAPDATHTLTVGGTATNPIAWNTWAQIVVTVDDTGCYLYINGEADSNNPIGFGPPHGAFRVQPISNLVTMGNDTSLVNGINGIIGEVRFFSTPISSGAVLEMFNQRRSVYGCLPSGWFNQDIGSPTAGSTTYSGGAFTIIGFGNEISGGTSDQLQFAYQIKTGDVTIIARAASRTGASGTPQFGVMVRDSLDPSSILFAVSGDNNVITYGTYDRTSFAGTVSNVQSGLGVGFNLPVWFKVTRVGNAFTSYLSNDGSSWTQQGGPFTLSISSTAYVGLFSDHNEGNSVSFDNVTI